MKKLYTIFSLLVLPFFLSSQNTVVDIVVNSDDHTILEDAVIAADLAGTLSGPGPFTVFAPTDDAFNALPDGTIDALLAEPQGALTDILLYHVVGAQALSSDLSDGQIITTLNGKDITVTINNDGVFINDAQVTVVDLQADNGVVHVLDAVLIPPTVTVVDVIVNSPDHTTLEAAVLAAGLETALVAEGPFTVFAPTDDAFNALPDGTIDALLADPQGALTDILLYHVVGAQALSSDLSDGQTITTLNGKDITVTINNDGVFINDAQVTVADIETDNGVVHVIDAVLIPPTVTVVDVIVNSPDHTILEAAVLAAGLETALAAEGPFTVFAPTDDAFNALPDGTIDALLADPQGALTDILLYHVVGAQALSSDLSDGQIITSLNGKDITVTINNDGVFINDAQVTVADIETDNGVVHVIDAVLIPPVTTLFDIIQESPDHNTLEAAIEAAGLDGLLENDGPFTVFAPTDDAFAALPQQLLDALLADPQGLLADILAYHVIPGSVRSTMLSDGQTATTLLGADIEVTINNDGIFINDAQVIVADIEADNGIVHVIDAVLTPPPTTVVDIIVGSPVHNTLEAAVVAADLAATLSGTGPFTVFAPTDAAFAALPDGTLDALLADPQGLLTDILLYHVVGANALSTDLSDGQVITTLNGKDITVNINNNGVFINDAQVVFADIVASNGVVHVIDAVLIPPTRTVVDVIVESSDHTILETAVVAADLAGTLSGDGPFTVFAPSDDAFAALPDGTIDALLADPQGLLTDILLYHVLGAEVLSSDLSDGASVTTLNGQDVTVSINAQGVFINDAQVTVADIQTDNGVVHVIDTVLIPSTSSTEDIDSALSRINVYPNPANDVLNVELDGLSAEQSVFRIFDLTGRQVKTVQEQNQLFQINISDLDSGIYYLDYRNQENSYQKKFIKN